MPGSRDVTPPPSPPLAARHRSVGAGCYFILGGEGFFSGGIEWEARFLVPILAVRDKTVSFLPALLLLSLFVLLEARAPLFFASSSLGLSGVTDGFGLVVVLVAHHADEAFYDGSRVCLLRKRRKRNRELLCYRWMLAVCFTAMRSAKFVFGLDEKGH